MTTCWRPIRSFFKCWRRKVARTARRYSHLGFGEFFADPRNAVFRAHSLWQDLQPQDFLLHKLTENVVDESGRVAGQTQHPQAAGPWDERLSLDDDGEYFARVVAASQRIKFVPAAHSYYRRGHVGSLSRSLSDRACESLLLSLQLRIGHLAHSRIVNAPASQGYVPAGLGGSGRLFLSGQRRSVESRRASGAGIGWKSQAAKAELEVRADPEGSWLACRKRTKMTVRT